ncbi:50S ribosomal protein L11 methyltransferase [Litorimonas sp. WD9-15]|uniref:50S ribosomal protein L11 methyltransferase n=1 Tax=Litorimonas sp. WD9-15 TaxID=3418716 RepID=UPI003CFDFB36
MTLTTPFALDIITTPDIAFDLADALGMEGEMSALGVTIFDAPSGKMLVQALFQSQTDAETVLASLDAFSGFDSKIHQLPETDWVSETQSGLPPVIAGRFFVHGAHDSDKIPEDKIAIHVEAGLAFGTGHHGTTAGCLQIFSERLDRGFAPNRILDLGCGAGILAIAAAKTLSAANIIATDIDHDAIMVTEQNATENAVPGRISAHVADGFDSPALKSRQFDLIFANILAGPLMGLAEDIVSATAPDGTVVLSGILDEKAEEVARCFEKAGLKVTPQSSIEGWTSLLAIKAQ